MELDVEFKADGLKESELVKDLIFSSLNCFSKSNTQG